MIAYARVNGVTAFWAANPNTDAGDVRMHWPTEGGAMLLVKQAESRCILVSSGVSPSEKMYARFRPCDAKLGSGILTVAAAAVSIPKSALESTDPNVSGIPQPLSVQQAPPPPPGATVKHWYDPKQAPPPPPSIKRAALELFVRREVRPRVELICAGGLEGSRHQKVCLAVAKTLSNWQPIAGAGIVAPFCQRICWHSCHGESHIGGVRDCPIQTNSASTHTFRLANGTPRVSFSGRRWVFKLPNGELRPRLMRRVFAS